MRDVVVLISGSGSNLAALLKAQAEARSCGAEAPYNIVAVGADRVCDGLEHAREFGVPTFVVEPKNYPDRAAWGRALAQHIRVAAQRPLVVSAGLMRILPPQFVGEFSPNLINTHPALLPKYPGAHAVRDALADGAQETGVTVHIVDEGVDTGPVIAQQTVAVRENDSEAELHERIKNVERPLLIDVVSRISGGSLDLAELAREAEPGRA